MLRISLVLASSLIALLLARVVALLLAADPAHPFVRMVLALTAPLVLPVAWIDELQPTTGVRFERGTTLLALGILAALAAGLAYRSRRRRANG
jgi:hypothetical protein